MRLKAFIILILSFLAILFSYTPSFAGDSDDYTWYGTGEDSVALKENMVATGTVIAAAMESAGYRAQAIILKDLKEMLGSIALLIYVSCFIFAIFNFVVHGKYEAGFWLLIGPALFHFMVLNTTKATGAEWRFGAFDGGSVEVKELLSEGLKDKDSSYEVSWVFHEFNVFISGVVQSLVAVVTDNTIRVQSLFTVRQRILSSLIESSIRENGLSALASYTLSTCSREFNAARVIALGKRNPDYRNTDEYRRAATFYFNQPFDKIANAFNVIYEADRDPSLRKTSAYSDAKSVIDDLSSSVRMVKKPILNKMALDYLVGLYAYIKENGYNIPIMDLKNPAVEQPLTNFVASCLDLDSVKTLEKDGGVANQTMMTCEQMSCWLGAGIQLEVIKNMKRAVKEYATALDGMDKDKHDNFLSEIYNDIAMKISTPKGVVANAFEKVPVIGQEGRMTEEQKEVYVGANVKPDPSVIPIIMAGYMFKKAVLVHDHLSDSIGKGFRTRDIADSNNYDITRGKDESYSEDAKAEFIERWKEDQLGTHERSKLYVFSMFLPYLQGIFLYTLSLIYPFFCIVVLVPEKVSSFLGWLSFWVWVKIWDLGFALVMIADAVLWDLLPHSGSFDPLRDPNNGPITMFEVAFDSDGAYNLANYYSLLGLMLIAVPLVSGRFLLGAKIAIAQSFISEIKEFSDRYGAQAATFLAHEQLIREEVPAYANRTNYAINSMNNVLDYTFADPKDIPSSNGVSSRIKQLKENANALYKKGEAYSEAGSELMAKGGGALATMASMGYLTPAGAAVGTLMFNRQVTNQLGLSREYKRLSNVANAKASLYNYTMQEYLYSTGSAMTDSHSFRAAISDRIEFFRNQITPQNVPKDLRVEQLNLDKAVLEQDIRNIFGAVIGQKQK